MTGAEARIARAFAGAEIGDHAQWVSRGPIGGPVSNPEFPISGICPMGLAETGRQLPLRAPSRLVVLCAWAQAQIFGSGEPELLSCSAQTIGRLRTSRVTVRSAGARPSAIASMMRGER
jgi:hypothetical protein